MPKLPRTRQTREASSAPERAQPAAPTRAAVQRHLRPDAIVQRAMAARQSLRPAELLAMQRAIGNRGVGAMLGRAPVQPKLTINTTGDRWDRAADAVMHRHDETPGPQPSRSVMPKPNPTHESDGGLAPGEEFARQLQASRGRPLPPILRETFEEKMDADFSSVRVHTDAAAEGLSRAIGGQAFTRGPDIFVGPGRFRPDTAHGQQLIGHELAHVVQQRKGRVRNPSGVGVTVVQDRALEAEAERMGQRAASSRVKAAPAAAAAGRRTLADAGLASRPTHPRSHSPVQMLPKKKQVKNFFTLGIRIAYVKHKRAMRAAAAAAVQQQQHEQIYHSAVKYHSTKAQNVPSITEHGLLNYEDRDKILGRDIGGMSLKYHSKFGGDEKKGVFFGGHEFAAHEKRDANSPLNEGNPSRIRILLPAERNKEPDYELEQPSRPNDPRHFFDQNYPGPGGGGRYTQVSIGPDYIWSGKFTLLPLEKQQRICETIRVYYPLPQPTWEQILQTHLQAINDGEVSDDALDNIPSAI